MLTRAWPVLLAAVYVAAVACAPVGRNVVNCGDPPRVDALPQSAGEGLIAFLSDRAGAAGPYLMRPDGSEAAALLYCSSFKYQGRMAWSPDGTQFAFAVTRGNRSMIYTMPLVGFLIAPLYRQSDANDHSPDWSPDGRFIAFGRAAPGSKTSQIIVADVSGTDTRTLVDDGGNAGFPVWSPDGKSIAFSSDASVGTQIYVTSADGSQRPRQLTSIGQNARPAWSPDGTRIAFQSNRDGTDRIYVMKADGSDTRRLADAPARSFVPVWSPDGRAIAFDVEEAGKSQIYIVGSDGTNVRKLTSGPNNQSPSWTRSR